MDLFRLQVCKHHHQLIFQKYISGIKIGYDIEGMCNNVTTVIDNLVVLFCI